jgi:hypothetical protein
VRSLCVHTHTHTHTYTHKLHTKSFPSYLNKTPLIYAYIFISGDINRRGDVSVYGLKAYGEVGIENDAFLISAQHANKWRALSLGRFAPGFH